MDEKGFAIGILKKTRRVVNIRLLKQGKLKGAGQDGNRSWVSMIGSICADGTYLPAGIIFKGQGGLQDTWVEEFDADNEIAYFCSTPSGYTNEDIAFLWLSRTFDRATREKANGRWRVLWVDGHNSHINMRFLNWCHNNRIFVAMFPSHATHRLQPLDISCFSPLATRYNQHLNAWLAKHGGIITLGQRDFYGLFKPALIEAFTAKNIKSGWKKTGIHPFDASVVLNQLDRNQSQPEPSQSQQPQQPLPLQAQPEWRKMRRELAGAKNTNPLNQVILQGFESLSTQHILLHAELQGVKESLQLQKKKNVRSKNIFEQIIEKDGNRAIFFSPAKIKEARELEQQKLDDEEREQQEKEDRALQRRLAKEEKEQQLQKRREEREKAQKERAAALAQKRAEIDARKQQREEMKRRKSEAKITAKSPEKKANQSQIRKTVVVDIESSEEPESSKSAVTRAGRKTRPIRHFDQRNTEAKL